MAISTSANSFRKNRERPTVLQPVAESRDSSLWWLRITTLASKSWLLLPVVGLTEQEAAMDAGGEGVKNNQKGEITSFGYDLDGETRQ